MSKEAVLKPLKDEERVFVDEMVINGLNADEAYSVAFNAPLTEESKKSIHNKATRRLNKPNVKSLYEAKMEEVRSEQVKKSVWSKEKSEEKLVRLIEKAEEDLYENGEKITMARLSAIMQPIKELNMINGYNQTNINLNANEMVQFVGEDDILE